MCHWYFDFNSSLPQRFDEELPVPLTCKHHHTIFASHLWPKADIPPFQVDCLVGGDRGLRDENSSRSSSATNVTLIQIKYSKFGNVTSLHCACEVRPSSRKVLTEQPAADERELSIANDGTNVAAATIRIGDHRNAIDWVRSDRSLRGQASGAD